MALTTYSQLLEALPGRVLGIRKTPPSVSSSGASNIGVDYWKAAGSPAAGSTPPTGAGEACTSSTTGALELYPAGAGAQLYIAGITLSVDSTGSPSAIPSFEVCDRLVHTSGIVGSTTNPQTVNTTALSRYTSGEGVQIRLQVHTTASANATNTFTVSYTNQAGTSGRTSPAVTTANTPVAHVFYRVPLQAGDTGVRSVESVTFSATFTPTAGDFGITLVKPLFMHSIGTLKPAIRRWPATLVPISNTACLGLAAQSLGLTSSNLVGSLATVQG